MTVTSAEPRGSAELEVVNPATGTRIGTAPMLDATEVAALAERGRAAQPAQGQAPTPAQYAATLADLLSLDDALGQMMMVQFDGQEPTPDVIQMVNQQSAGGVLFFGGNIGSADQIRATIAQLQRIAPVPPLLAVDQEGGPVNRFQNIVGDLPAAATLATPADATARGKQDADILRRDVDFFLARAGVDIRSIGFRRGGVGFGLLGGGRELRGAEHGQHIAPTHLLPRNHPN